VRDSAARLWSVKLGEEAQSEVTASRILWAIGFHQPAVYYVAQWTLSGEDAGPQPAGRFRSNPSGVDTHDEWSWYDNPFMSTGPFRGLIVAQLILNNWDLKASNNKIYVTPDAAAGPRRQYIVRDLGASLGKAKQFSLLKSLGIRDKQGSKNDLAGFERQGFIKRVEGDRIVFDYRGLDSRLVRIITPADVIWTCELLARLSDQQWYDVFIAGGYGPDERDRYISKIKHKVAQGLALRTQMTR
jgi:hypothetical protein